ncbi:hypothetical protein PVL29_006385 [Vitis rotundifolia]|uniref:FAD-binding domain-containing protein n=1 Tax=Vitis rotundifolia TaxID=103349 RepID=A0AA39A5T5_VITRO|nr:hypothetical protein PVL29_006385 [Vitis rotundifolia]
MCKGCISFLLVQRDRVASKSEGSACTSFSKIACTFCISHISSFSNLLSIAANFAFKGVSWDFRSLGSGAIYKRGDSGHFAPKVQKKTAAAVLYFSSRFPSLSQILWEHISSHILERERRLQQIKWISSGFSVFNLQEVSLKRQTKYQKNILKTQLIHKSTQNIYKNLFFQIKFNDFASNHLPTMMDSTSSSLHGSVAKLELVGDKFNNIVWTMNPKESSTCREMNENDFVKALNHALNYGYGPHIFSWFRSDLTFLANECFEVLPDVVKFVSGRMVFPLSLRHANNYASKRVVLIGDATHTIHSLAGQGVKSGFGDAFALSRIISEGIVLSTDIGERKRENIMMMAILDGFQKAYSVDFGPLNAAFYGAQYISPLKRSIISYASGEQIAAVLLKSVLLSPVN